MIFHKHKWKEITHFERTLFWQHNYYYLYACDCGATKWDCEYITEDLTLK